MFNNNEFMPTNMILQDRHLLVRPKLILSVIRKPIAGHAHLLKLLRRITLFDLELG